MSNSTAEFWDVDGVSLNTDTENLTSWGGSREAPADLRGKNRTVPYLPGTLWVPKVPDEREVELSGWVVGPTVAEARVKWRKLRALLWRPHEQFALTRRWKDENGLLHTATGLAEYRSGLEPEVSAGGSRLLFKVKLIMADPFFYEAEKTLSLPVGDTAFVLPGDYPTQKITLVIPPGMSKARISVMTGTSIDNWLEYSGTPAGATATVSVEKWTATELLAGNTTRTFGKVTHGGRPQWLVMVPKVTKLRLAATAGAGPVQFKYRAAWH